MSGPPEVDGDRRQMRRIFAGIYATQAWGGESVSGPGSTCGRASSFLPDLIRLVRDLGVSTLLDAPCGDFNWAEPLADSVPDYVGIDVVPQLVRRNRRQFGSPRRRFLCRDLVRDRLPATDLVLCRDALVHFSFDDARRALANLRATGATYLVATTFVGDRRNEEIATGGWRPLNLQRPPFDLPAPLAGVDEQCHHTGGIYADKRLALWRMADLALRL